MDGENIETQCDKCGVGTEHYLQFKTKNSKVTLCSNCCRDFVLKLINNNLIQINDMYLFANDQF